MMNTKKKCKITVVETKKKFVSCDEREDEKQSKKQLRKKHLNKIFK